MKNVAIAAAAVFAACASFPAAAQEISDAQVCVNPALRGPVLQGVQNKKASDVTAANPAGMDVLIRDGKHLKELVDPELVSRNPKEIVCRYTSVWTGPDNAPETRAKFIIKVISTSSGGADIDAYLE